MAEYSKIDSDTLRVINETIMKRKDILFNIVYFEGERDKIQSRIDELNANLDLLDKED